MRLVGVAARKAEGIVVDAARAGRFQALRMRAVQGQPLADFVLVDDVESLHQHLVDDHALDRRQSQVEHVEQAARHVAAGRIVLLG